MTLGEALDNAGNSDQKAMCTAPILALTQPQCKDLLEGQELSITQADLLSFNKLCKYRISNGQTILPFSGMQFNVHPDLTW